MDNKLLAAGATVIVVGGLLFASTKLENLMNNKKNSNVSYDSSITESKKDNSSSKEKDDKENNLIESTDDPNSGGTGLTAETSDAYVYNGNSVSEALVSYFKDKPIYGGYGTSDELWHVEDMTDEYSSYDNKFINLYSFMSYGYFTEDRSIPLVEDPTMTIDYAAGNEITIQGFATVEKGTVTIHRIESANELLIDDGYVDHDMYMIMNGITG